MSEAAFSGPKSADLYRASLVATALVYGVGSAIYSVILFALSKEGGFGLFVQTLLAFGSIGVVVATVLALVVVAPLGTVFGSAILRLTPPGWLQGPLTGALVALALEAIVVFFIAQQPMEAEWGNAVMLAYPIALAMIAGAMVQRYMLQWPSVPNKSA